MKQNAMERDAADADQDGKLNFKEFCQFIKDREEGEPTEADLRKRFDALDGDGSGKIDMSEYLMFSLKDALIRSSARVVDLFKKWDEDRSGKINKREFTHAVRALGFREITDAMAGECFEALDDDKSGELEYKELNMMLRKDFKGGVMAKLKRAKDVSDDSYARGSFNFKHNNSNYKSARLAALPPMVNLCYVPGGDTIAEQLTSILSEHSVKLIDLFREWDEDGNGAIDKAEFRKAVAALGYDAPKRDINDAFKALDHSGDGYIEYDELKAALSKHSKKGKQKKKPRVKGQAESDVEGTGEETFEEGMKQNAMERDAADADQDGKLDFAEFCQFIKDREDANYTIEELRQRFNSLDNDGSGRSICPSTSSGRSVMRSPAPRTASSISSKSGTRTRAERSISANSRMPSARLALMRLTTRSRRRSLIALMTTSRASSSTRS